MIDRRSRNNCCKSSSAKPLDKNNSTSTVSCSSAQQQKYQIKFRTFKRMLLPNLSKENEFCQKKMIEQYQGSGRRISQPAVPLFLPRKCQMISSYPTKP